MDSFVDPLFQSIVIHSSRWNIAQGDFVLLNCGSIVQIKLCLHFDRADPFCIAFKVNVTCGTEPFKGTLTDELCLVEATAIRCALLHAGGSATAPVMTFLIPLSITLSCV